MASVQNGRDRDEEKHEEKHETVGKIEVHRDDDHLKLDVDNANEPDEQERLLRSEQETYPRPRAFRPPAVLAVWRQVDTEFTEIDPSLYYKAASECLFAGLGLAWIVTLLTKPDFPDENPVKDALGYNNVCVGFDSKPAKFVMAPFVTAQAYFFIRYASTDITRAYQMFTERSEHKQLVIALVANIAHGLTVLALPMLLIVSPFESLWGHTGVFFADIFTREFVVAAHFYKMWSHVSWIQKAWFVLYSFFSIVGPALATIQIAMSLRANGPHDDFFPPVLLMSMDFGWFILLAFATQMLPSAPLIARIFRLTEPPQFKGFYGETDYSSKPITLPEHYRGPPNTCKSYAKMAVMGIIFLAVGLPVIILLLTLGLVGHLLVGLVLLPIGCCKGQGCSSENTGARILKDLVAPVRAYFLNEDQQERFTKAFLSLKILQLDTPEEDFHTSNTMGTFTGELRINDDLPHDLRQGYLIPGARHEIAMRLSASIASRDTWVKFQYGPDHQETTLIMSCPHTRFYSDPWHPLFLFWVLGKGGKMRFLQVMFNPSFWTKALMPSMTLKKECDTHTYATSMADTRFGSCQSYAFGEERAYKFYLIPEKPKFNPLICSPFQATPEIRELMMNEFESKPEVKYAFCIQVQDRNRFYDDTDSWPEWDTRYLPLQKVGELVLPRQDYKREASYKAVRNCRYNIADNPPQMLGLSNLTPIRIFIYEHVCKVRSERAGKPTLTTPQLLAELKQNTAKAAEWEPEPEARGGLKGGVCMAVSGGGWRALAVGMGAARGLSELGLLQAPESFSSVSGGTWFTTQLLFSQKFYDALTGDQPLVTVVKEWFNAYYTLEEDHSITGKLVAAFLGEKGSFLYTMLHVGAHFDYRWNRFISAMLNTYTPGLDDLKCENASRAVDALKAKALFVQGNFLSEARIGHDVTYQQYEDGQFAAKTAEDMQPLCYELLPDEREPTFCLAGREDPTVHVVSKQEGADGVRKALRLEGALSVGRITAVSSAAAGFVASDKMMDEFLNNSLEGFKHGLATALSVADNALNRELYTMAPAINVGEVRAIDGGYTDNLGVCGALASLQKHLSKKFPDPSKAPVLRLFVLDSGSGSGGDIKHDASYARLFTKEDPAQWEKTEELFDKFELPDTWVFDDFRTETNKDLQDEYGVRWVQTRVVPTVENKYFGVKKGWKAQLFLIRNCIAAPTMNVMSDGSKEYVSVAISMHKAVLKLGDEIKKFFSEGAADGLDVVVSADV